MQIRAVRDVKVVLPGDKPDDLPRWERIPRAGEAVTEAVVTGGTWTRATLEDVSMTRSWLSGADLSAMTLTSARLDRCVLTGCSLVGAHLDAVTLKDVIFENCRLDYATLHHLKAAGPVAFIGCSLTETTLSSCTLPTVVFDGCKFAGLTIEQCDLRGADLRGNDLAGLACATALRGTIVSDSQLPALTQLLVNELSIKIKTGLR
ncbi:hypothetical protein DMB66_36520 [Actinoplanes sp. ATCC 53533]|uniref:pentapeptide repeat-containing protein n=1 Tax=Actinoplanes sp. ATCC 53533 TaxID=1288362 RepID=UPI000F77C30D|nr:pentapeptide repeat-containing protein [Actinoplanes sp. ATCC 53533]RSM55055.1 hypothetical protein DMB66_36520 [Actinoplanes sp. ATCC 53533]